MPILILGIILILLILSIIVTAYFFDTVIKSDSLVRRMRKTVREEPPEGEFFVRMREAGKAEDVYMQSEDGLLLHALRIFAEDDPDGKKWAVICHGYTGNSRRMADYAELFYRLGLSTLSVDMRGHGESEGKYRGFGWQDSFDICDWTDWLIEHYGDDIRVAYFGLSMGGATVMNASGHDLPANVRCIIEDCGYTSTKDILKYSMKKRHGLPSFPLLNELSLMTRIFAGYSLRKDGNALKQVKESVTPILFIHGEADDFVPFKMVKKLYKNAGSEKELYTVENAAHCESLKTDESVYFQTISDYLERHFDIAEKA